MDSRIGIGTLHSGADALWHVLVDGVEMLRSVQDYMGDFAISGRFVEYAARCCCHDRILEADLQQIKLKRTG
jgi:hypothetical protein